MSIIAHILVYILHPPPCMSKATCRLPEVHAEPHVADISSACPAVYLLANTKTKARLYRSITTTLTAGSQQLARHPSTPCHVGMGFSHCYLANNGDEHIPDEGCCCQERGENADHAIGQCAERQGLWLLASEGGSAQTACSASGSQATGNGVLDAHCAHEAWAEIGTQQALQQHCSSRDGERSVQLVGNGKGQGDGDTAGDEGACQACL
mmetsp:Transcript_40161/g.89104  ORF Transcript_40161/g.89104 Transcript_40161/m.89104 type:complete len:209 (-) Transcript_40161:1356-1982(-)